MTCFESMTDLERSKYEKVWADPEYLNCSPSDYYLETFLDIAQPKKGETLIELGCGSASAAMKLVNDHNLRIQLLDITPYDKMPLVDEAKKYVEASNGERYWQRSLWDAWYDGNVKRDLPCFEYGYCCDVMEHIPLEYVMLTLDRMKTACNYLFFCICNVQDYFGPKVVGEPLHLSVLPFQWWLSKMKEIGEVLDARDLSNDSLFYVRCNQC